MNKINVQRNSDMPHIFMVITKGDVGGAQVHVLTLMAQLKSQIKFTLGCGEHDFITEQAAKMGIDVIIIPHLQRAISPVADFKCWLAMKKILKRLKPDLVHLHSSKAGIIGRLAAKFAGVKSLFTAHGWAFTEGVSLKQKCYGLVAEWLMAKIGDGIIMVSKYDYDLAHHYKIPVENKHWAVQNCISGFGKKIIKKQNDIVRILNVGRLVDQKNQRLLIEAIAMLEQDFRLDIIGAGILYNELTQLIKHYKLENKVKLAGSSNDLKTYISKADIFVLSSDYEGLPLSILEAMSAGLPVVSTNVGGVNEVVCDGETGALVNRGDARALSEKLSELIEDENLRQRWGENGYQRYLQNFQSMKMCDKTLSIYKFLTASS